MALRAGVTVGIQTAARATSPTPATVQGLRMFTRAIGDTSNRLQLQHDSVKQCWQKLSKSEKMAADMVDKILTATECVERLNGKLQATRSAVTKKQKLCGELRQMIDFNKTKLSSSGQTAKWMEFHNNEMGRKLADNARWIEDYTKERVNYQNKLKSVLAELNTVKYKLEDADENVRYIEQFRDTMDAEHEEEMFGLRLAIKEAYVTRNSMMAAKPDAMSCVVRQLLPDEEDYDQLVAETEDINMKVATLRKRLNEQANEMLYYHSKNHELSLRIKELVDNVKVAKEQRRPASSNVNAHAHIWKKNPVTWFQPPNMGMEKVKDFLIKAHGKEFESSIVQYLKVKSENESRWHSQMFEKDFVEYERTIDVVTERYTGAAPVESNTFKSNELETQQALEDESCEEVSDLTTLTKPSSALSLDDVQLTESELQLCAAVASGVKPVVVDNIGKIQQTRVTKPRNRIINRLMSFFRR